MLKLHFKVKRTFNVMVDDITFVHVFHSMQKLECKVDDFFVVEWSILLNVVLQRSSWKI